MQDTGIERGDSPLHCLEGSGRISAKLSHLMHAVQVFKYPSLLDLAQSRDRLKPQTLKQNAKINHQSANYRSWSAWIYEAKWKRVHLYKVVIRFSNAHALYCTKKTPVLHRHQTYNYRTYWRHYQSQALLEHLTESFWQFEEVLQKTTEASN